MSDHEFAVGGAILLGVIMNAWIIAFLVITLRNKTHKKAGEAV